MMTENIGTAEIPKPKVIAFCGPKGSGKDTAANRIIERAVANETATRDYMKVNFADPVKSVCAQMFRLSWDEMNNPAYKEQVLTRWPFKSPRELMQWIAQISRDSFADDIWAQNWLTRIRRYNEDGGIKPDIFITTDVRYPNELDVLAQTDYKLIYIYNPAVEDARRRGGGYWNHPSEQHYDLLYAKCTVMIMNDGSIKHLHKKVDVHYDAWALKDLALLELVTPGSIPF